jgi:hypothetical protein
MITQNGNMLSAKNGRCENMINTVPDEIIEYKFLYLAPAVLPAQLKGCLNALCRREP